MRNSMLPWLPYVIHPSSPAAGRPRPELIHLQLPPGESDWPAAFRAETVQTVQVWPFDVVASAFVARATEWHLRARGAWPSTELATVDEIRAWILTTQSLAARLPFGPTISEQMDGIAARLQRTLDSPARFFVRCPTSRGTKQDAEWRTSMELWALDRLLRAVNDCDPFLYSPPTKFWPAMFEGSQPDGADSDPAFADYKEAQKRVSRLEETIQPAQRDVLMVHLLHDALQNGSI